MAGGSRLKIPFKFENKKLFTDIIKGKYTKNASKLSKQAVKDIQEYIGKIFNL